MENLCVNIDDKQDEEISNLAMKHYGDDSKASRQRVIETALKMRILWSQLVERGQQETDEAVSRWEFAESPSIRENSDRIQHWLFRR